MPLPSPSFVSPGDVAWQLTAATFVGLQSIPGLALLYAGLVPRKWSVNSMLMAFYAFCAVLVVWALWGYRMSFGPPLHLGPGPLADLVGIPGSVLNAGMEQARATIPLLAGAMPRLGYTMPALVYFQFAFAAITPILLAGSVLGRINFRAWMLFVPLWTTFVYCVNAFMLWGGGWLAQLGAVDYSGGYVIHVAAGVSGFVAAAMVGPRLEEDRRRFGPGNLIMAMAVAGIIWLGWNGFNGGDPYFANANAALAVLNTNLATATAAITWMFLDHGALGRVSLVGAINGMIAGLVAITPAAGYVNGYGAGLIGLAAGALPWCTLRWAGRSALMKKVDDTLGVLHTHAVAGALGGLMTGLLADPAVLEYVGHGKAPGVSVAGLFYGNPHQLLVQALALAVVVAYDAAATAGLLALIARLVPLRASQREMAAGDPAIHGEGHEADRPAVSPRPVPET